MSTWWCSLFFESDGETLRRHYLHQLKKLHVEVIRWNQLVRNSCALSLRIFPCSCRQVLSLFLSRFSLFLSLVSLSLSLCVSQSVSNAAPVCLFFSRVFWTVRARSISRLEFDIVEEKRNDFLVAVLMIICFDCSWSRWILKEKRSYRDINNCYQLIERHRYWSNMEMARQVGRMGRDAAEDIYYRVSG